MIACKLIPSMYRPENIANLHAVSNDLDHRDISGYLVFRHRRKIHLFHLPHPPLPKPLLMQPPVLFVLRPI